MTLELEKFIEDYRKQVLSGMFPKLSIIDIMKQHNHEIWQACPKCGQVEDLKKTWECSTCGATIFTSSKP